MQNEPTITCPNCRTAVKLTESLAAPLIESTRAEYERRLAKKEADVAGRERLLTEQAAVLQQQKESLGFQVAEKLKTERGKIAADEARKAKLSLAADFDEKNKQMAELQEVLKQRDIKLAEAQKAQADLLRKGRELDDAKRELDLTIEKRVNSSLVNVREQAKREAEEALQIKVLEKEHIIQSMQTQIEELKRKSEQGSQQLQGEVLELQLENQLGTRFPDDLILPVPKGEHGGDLLHRVSLNRGGNCCGTILWEIKRTKNWVDGWLPKLRDDQRAAKAEIAVLVSYALPKDITVFDFRDGVWITHPRSLLPVALSLRQALISVHNAKLAGQNQQTKMEQVYRYLTGPNFKLRMEAIVESFTTMQSDLQKERAMIMKQWAKRESQIARVTEATVGMYGDFQSIAGATMSEIGGLDFPMLEGDVAPS